MLLQAQGLETEVTRLKRELQDAEQAAAGLNHSIGRLQENTRRLGAFEQEAAELKTTISSLQEDMRAATVRNQEQATRLHQLEMYGHQVSESWAFIDESGCTVDFAGNQGA